MKQKLNASLAEFSRLASEYESSADIYGEFSRVLAQLVKFDRLLVRFVNPESGALAETFDTSHTEPPGDEGAAGLSQVATGEPITLSDEPILIPDCTTPSALSRFPYLKQGPRELQSLACVPLKHRGATVGSMLVTSQKKNSFSDKDVETLQIAAAHIAPLVMSALQIRQLEREVRERTVLADIGRTISSTIDLKLVWDDFVKAVQSLLPCDRLVMAIQQGDSDQIEDKYVWGVPLPNWDESPRRMVRGTPSQEVLESRVARIITTEEADRSSVELMGYSMSKKTGLQSSMITPLVAGNQLIGTLNIKALKPDAYTSESLALFELLAMQVAGSVAASELYSGSVKHAEEAAAKGDLELKNKQLVETDATRSRFISSITHELRTPLTSIVAASDQLKNDQENRPDEKSARYLDMITRNTKRLHELIENLLDLSDMEGEGLWLSGTPFTLYRAVKDAIASIKPIADTKFQRLVTEFPAIDTVIKADRERMVQVMANLLSNGCKYSPNYKEVRLKVVVGDNQVEISVIDQGDGIAEEDQTLIFDEFSRLDNKITKANSGRGLGLSISRKLARVMGGDITVSSEVGKGSVFTLIMPVELAEAA